MFLIIKYLLILIIPSDGQHLVSGTTDGELFVWNIKEAIDSRPPDEHDVIQPTYRKNGGIFNIYIFIHINT